VLCNRTRIEQFSARGKGKTGSLVLYLLTQGCTSAIFFEVRKKMDLYLWMAKTPDGPSAKFLVENSEL